MRWFTSDLHLGHYNIIRYCNRPFKDAIEMDETIINNINSVVGESDVLYIIGDFAFCRDTYSIEKYLKRFNCNYIVFVFGNHDRNLQLFFGKDWCKSIGEKKTISKFKEIADISINENNVKKDITLCHFPMRTWNKSHYGAWHLYGHCHGKLKDDPTSFSFDVGVDTNNFFPYSFQQIVDKMSKKQYCPNLVKDGRELSKE